MSTLPAPDTAPPSIHVQGDVQGSIVFGDNNFVVNSNHGTIVYTAPRPRVSRIAVKPPRPRPPLFFLDRAVEVQRASSILFNFQPLAIYGPEGIGKTTFLKQIANLIPLEQFPDGVVFLDGEWEAISASQLDGVMQHIFTSLFESDPPIKVDIAAIRTYLGSLQPLIVLDQLTLSPKSWQQLPELLPSAGLIWAVPYAPPGQTAWELQLSGLPPEDSRKLLLNATGMVEDEAVTHILDQVCASLDYHPLAIVTFGRWMRSRDIPLPVALGQINEQASGEKDGDERALAAIIASLDGSEEELLSLLAAVGGPMLDRTTLVQASSVAAPQADIALHQLEQTGLVHSSLSGLGLHPVHKAALRLLLPATDMQRSRLTQSILRYVSAHRSSPEIVRSQLANLLGALDESLSAGRVDVASVAARLAAPQLVLSGKWKLWRETFQRVSSAARQSGDSPELARALHELGTHQLATGDRTQAVNLLTQARDLRLQIGDQLGAAYSQHNLNHILGPPPPGEPPEAIPTSPSSPHLPWIILGGIALLSLAILGGFFLTRAFALPAPTPTRTSTVAISEDINRLTDTPTNTPSPTSIRRFTPTKSPTPTSTSSHTPTLTPTHTPTETPTSTPTSTPTTTRTPTPTPTRTPTPYPEPFGFIVFGSDWNTSNMEIYRMRADGGGWRRLTDITGNDNRPDISNDGAHIAFIHGRDPNRNIYYTSETWTSYGPILSNADENNPSWSPNGRYFVYQSDQDGDFEIFKYDTLTGNSEPLTRNNRRDACPDWSPKGGKIAYNSTRNDNQDIYVMNEDGSNPDRLTNHPQRDICPAWSPDGNRIAFNSRRSGTDQIWIMNKDGSDEKQLTNIAAPASGQPVLGAATWSPDGNWLAFTARHNNNWDIFIIRADGKDLRNLTNRLSTDTFPSWVERLNLNPTYKPPTGPVD